MDGVVDGRKGGELGGEEGSVAPALHQVHHVSLTRHLPIGLKVIQISQRNLPLRIYLPSLYPIFYLSIYTHMYKYLSCIFGRKTYLIITCLTNRSFTNIRNNDILYIITGKSLPVNTHSHTHIETHNTHNVRHMNTRIITHIHLSIADFLPSLLRLGAGYSKQVSRIKYESESKLRD